MAYMERLQMVFDFNIHFFVYKKQSHVLGPKNIDVALSIGSVDPCLQITLSYVASVYKQKALSMQKQISVHPNLIFLLPLSAI